MKTKSKSRKKVIISIIVAACAVAGMSFAVVNAVKPDIFNKEIVKYDVKKVKPYAEKVNAFSCDMFSRVISEEENTFLSPFSVYSVLAMLGNGAAGNTQKELLDVLGTDDVNEMNEALGSFMKSRLDEDVDIYHANSVWLGDKLRKADNINESFITPLQAKYSAEVFEDVDFGLQATIDKANKWAAEKTNNNIDNVVSSFRKDTAILLMNAIYFNGKWEDPFERELTWKEYFNGSSAKKMVDIMHNAGSYKYYSDDKFAGLEMKYGEGIYVMDLLMSADEEQRTGDVWAGLTKEEQTAAIAAFDTKATYEEVSDLQLPKIDMEYSAEGMAELLKSMGIKEAFETDANLSSIGEQLFVSEVIHKTKLTIDEEATEASAVSLVGMDAAAPAEDMESLTYIVNRPFIFCIRDTQSGMILFTGEINNLGM